MMRENHPGRGKLNNKHNPFAFAVAGYQIIMGVIVLGQNSISSINLVCLQETTKSAKCIYIYPQNFLVLRYLQNNSKPLLAPT